MNENEKLREISRLVFSFALPGVTFKVGAQAIKAAGDIIHKAAVLLENAPSRYGFIISTLAQRPKISPYKVISEPLIGKYAELMAKSPETTRTLRPSTLGQRKNTSFMPGYSATSKPRSGKKLHPTNISNQWSLTANSSIFCSISI